MSDIKKLIKNLEAKYLIWYNTLDGKTTEEYVAAEDAIVNLVGNLEFDNIQLQRRINRLEIELANLKGE